MIKLGAVRAVVVFSDNPEELAAWYRRVFALSEIVSTPRFVGFGGDGIALFIQMTSEGHRPGVGGIRPHFTVEDCGLAFQTLLEAGARSLLVPTDTGDEIVAAVQDPEGNPIGLLATKK